MSSEVHLVNCPIAADHHFVRKDGGEKSEVTISQQQRAAIDHSLGSPARKAKSKISHCANGERSLARGDMQ